MAIGNISIVPNQEANRYLYLVMLSTDLIAEKGYNLSDVIVTVLISKFELLSAKSNR